MYTDEKVSLLCGQREKFAELTEFFLSLTKQTCFVNETKVFGKTNKLNRHSKFFLLAIQ